MNPIVHAAPDIETTDDALAAFVRLWKHLLAHDELTLAIDALRCAPWQVRERYGAELAEMKRITHEACLPISSMQNVLIWNWAKVAPWITAPPDEAIPSDSGMKPRWDFCHEAISREAERRGAPFQILDLGCQDGWIALRLALAGHHVTGVDIHKGYLERDVVEAAKLGVSDRTKWAFQLVGDPAADQTPINQFDAVVCMEVYEHVRDAALLRDYIAASTRPSGLLVLSTPHGSWHRGRPSELNGCWFTPRDHCRAVTVDDLVQAFSETFAIERIDVVPAQPQEVEGQAHIMLLARRRA